MNELGYLPTHDMAKGMKDITKSHSKLHHKIFELIFSVFWKSR